NKSRGTRFRRPLIQIPDEDALGNEQHPGIELTGIFNKPSKIMKIKLQRAIYMLSRYFLQGFVLQMLFFNFVLAVDVNAQYKKIDEVLVTLDKNELTLNQLFKQIEAETDFQFAYDRQDINRDLPIIVKTKKASVEDYLKQVAQQASLTFRQVNHNIDVKRNKKTQSVAEWVDVTIKGKVVDEKGEAVPGVTISLEGSNIGTVTDLEGNYSITVPEEATLTFSFIGYNTQRIVVGDQSVIDVVLVPDIQALSEVVV